MANDHQKAFKEAEKELQKDKINEIKEIMKEILQKIQAQQEKKSEAEESIRILKLDMDDLRHGKISKIKERHDKSKKAREISPIKESQLQQLQYFASPQSFLGTMTTGMSTNLVTSQAAPATVGVTVQSLSQQLNWGDATAGTYQVSCSNGTIKEFNL